MEITTWHGKGLFPVCGAPASEITLPCILPASGSVLSWWHTAIPPRELLQSKRAILPKVMPSLGQPTSNKRSCGVTRPAPCLIFRQLWRAILSPEFPVGLVEVSATTAFCITVQLLLLPSPHRCHSGNPSPINLLHAVLHSRVSGNQTYGGIRNGFRELSV